MNRLHHWYCQSNHWKRKLEAEILPWALDGVDLRGEVLELGPGPGFTTDWLSHRCSHITCLEIDSSAAHALRERIGNGKVSVKVGDATEMPFADGLFSVVLSFTMLHHVPSPALQDRVFREAFRVLKPGGIFLGADSMWSLRMWLFHFADTMVTVDPEEFPARLEAVGFKDVKVTGIKGRFRFLARHPELPLPADNTSDDTSARCRATSL